MLRQGIKGIISEEDFLVSQGMIKNIQGENLVEIKIKGRG
jgi:hypothetical protein